MLLPRRLVVTSLCALIGVLLYPLPTMAQDGFDGLCPLFLQEKQIELGDLELAAQMDETRLDVAEEIFVLIDSLWQNDLAERLPYLSVKHSRDVAAVTLEIARIRVGRQEAVLNQYRLACSVAADEQQPSASTNIEDAHERYLQADCAIRDLEVTVFEVDLEYHQEILQSARDLRQSDIASRQQVLFAERDLQITQDQLALARQRAARCRQ